MYFAVEVEARASLVQPPAPPRSAVSLEGVCVCLGVVSDDEVGEVGVDVGVVVTVGGVSETTGAVSVATPLASLE